MKYRLAVLLILAGLLSLSGSCAAPDSEGFAVYLTRDNIPPEKMEMLSHVEIADEPAFSVGDIVSYNAATHEITLKPDAFQRLADLEVPVRGKSFLVCIDKGPVYWGAFWAPLSSMSFSGVTIWVPFGSADSPAIRIGMGYPSPSFYSGKDPRNSLEVMKSLKKAGKLVNELPVTFIDELPQSMKGYELYSWQEGTDWHFRLITGTNRNKTYEEIISGENMVESWVSIHVTGIEELLAVFSKLPENEEVFWFGRQGLSHVQGQSFSFNRPDEATMGLIKNYSQCCGFDLAVFPDP